MLRVTRRSFAESVSTYLDKVAAGEEITIVDDDGTFLGRLLPTTPLQDLVARGKVKVPARDAEQIEKFKAVLDSIIGR